MSNAIGFLVNYSDDDQRFYSFDDYKFEIKDRTLILFAFLNDGNGDAFPFAFVNAWIDITIEFENGDDITPEDIKDMSVVKNLYSCLN